MSKIENILERATITFPKPLSFADTERLLLYLSKELQGEVHYSLEYPKSFVYNEKEKKSKLTLKDRMIKKVYIKNTKNNCFYEAFLGNFNENSLEFSTMVFDFAPNSGDSGFWDDVINIVGEYFKHKDDVKKSSGSKYKIN